MLLGFSNVGSTGMVTATVVTGTATGMGTVMAMGTGMLIKVVTGTVMAMEATATLIKVVTGIGTAMAMGTPTTTIRGTGTVGTGTVAGGVMESANAGSGHHTDTNGFATERLKETGRSLGAGTHQSTF